MKKEKEYIIEVNDVLVTFDTKDQTGASILREAEDQGAGVDNSFVLSLELENGDSEQIGPDDPIKLKRCGMIFIAVPNDDNSRGLGTAVEQAIAHIHQAFPEAEIEVTGDGNEGAFIIMEPVKLSEVYVQESTWIGFHIVKTCEYADTYPHFVRADLSRTDGRALGDALTVTTFNHPEKARQAVQISRRTNKPCPPSAKNPLLKLRKVLIWLNNR